MRACYINAMASGDTLKYDLKTLIHDANIRRRMSSILRSGVCTGMEAILLAAPAQIDAIITATGLGCLEDSEKFLKSMLVNDEGMLPPTPFIQSTFNTIGAQIALMCGNRGYNMTYSHRGRSFESALLDAMMQLHEEDVKNVLVGALDMKTPSQEKIMERMGFTRNAATGEGTHFFVISEEPTENCLAKVIAVDFPVALLTPDAAVELYGLSDNSVKLIWEDYTQCGIYHTASAYTFRKGIEWLQSNNTDSVLIYNTFRGEYPSVIILQWP
ncbi:MAG: beta-ketoacyl synthase chain length factor [Prolixibacteraceae bacterium]|nr:beta-ketoacyl synthase chain length factor [Prolixibacteraceae bacterium]